MSASEKGKFFNRASIAGGDECWEWKGARHGQGYGAITMRRAGRKTNLLAHRVAKGLALGRDLTSEENLHHTCADRLCVNPRHLLIVSRSEHKSDYDRLTHCKRGHEFTPENTKIVKGSQQVCLICRRENDSLNRKRRRLADPEWREKQRQRMKDYHARRRDVSE